MQEQVAAATEAAESAGQSKMVATEQAGVASSAAALSTENKEAAQLAAHQSGLSAEASEASADRSESARDSIIQSEQAAAASAAAAADSAAHAEEVTEGKAASGNNDDIKSLLALTAEGFDRLRQGIPPMVGATSTVAGKKGLAPEPAPGDQDRFLTGAGVYKEVGGGMPVGSIQPWGVSRATLPAGWIARDGQLLNRADWPDLWALVSASAVTDAVWLATPYTSRGKYSSGDGSTTFRMPDTNGKSTDGLTIAAMVLRGDGKSSAGTPGVHQADQMQGFRFGSSESSWLIDNAGYAGGVSNSADFRGIYAGTGTGASAANLPLKPFSDKANGTPRVGSETRSANETAIWCTVGAGKAVNSGTVDVTALATSVSNQSSIIADIQSKQVFTKETVVGPLALPAPGTDFTVTHNIGAIPKVCRLYIRYKSAANGMAIGEEQFIGEVQNYAGSALTWNCVAQRPTTTTIQIRTGAGGIYGFNASGAAQVSSSQVDLILRIYT